MCACENTKECKRLRWFQHHTLLPRLNIHRDWLKHLSQDHGPNRSHEGNGAYNGPFAFTLTMSPSWGLTSFDMIKAAQKLMSQKSCPVKKFAWYLEYGKPETFEHPHIHGMYETESGGRIEQKHFKRIWTKFWDEKKELGQGFVGGYHRPMKDNESYSKYIKKQGGVGESSDNF